MRREPRATIPMYPGHENRVTRFPIHDAQPLGSESDPFPEALSRIACIVSGTLELREAFTQVADVAREVLPVEAMGVCRLETPNVFKKYAVMGIEPEEESPTSVAGVEDFSPAMRPQAGKTLRFNDAPAELDPTYPMDLEILDCGVRSMICSPLMAGPRIDGEVWFTSSNL